jgi:hypothetical protein
LAEENRMSPRTITVVAVLVVVGLAIVLHTLDLTSLLGALNPHARP